MWSVCPFHPLTHVCHILTKPQLPYCTQVSYLTLGVFVGELLFSLAAHSLAVRQLWITSDGVVATASDDKEIRLWDLRMPWSTDMGTQIATCRGHKTAVTSVKMTRTGTGVLSASLDATIILWDVFNASPVRVFNGHKAPITQVRVLHIGNFFGD